MARIPKSLTFTIELWQKIDNNRRDIPRSRFVEKIVRRSLGDLN